MLQMSSRSGNTSSPAIDQPEPIDVESDVDDQIDQLDSDSDAESEEFKGEPWKRSPRPGTRGYGRSSLPAARMENILQSEGAIGDLAISKEGLLLLSVAAEELIKQLAERAHHHSKDKDNVLYEDLAKTVQESKAYEFLLGMSSRTIPNRVSLKDAVHWREEKMLEEEIALFGENYSSDDNAASKAKTKILVTNGKEKTNSGHNGGSVSGRRGQEMRGDVSRPSPVYAESLDEQHDLKPEIRHRSTSRNGASLSSEPLSVNGHTSGIPPSRIDPPSPSHHPRAPLYLKDEPPWPGQFTGPASGFLQGPGAPFGRPTQNLGRTIYSDQSPRPD